QIMVLRCPAVCCGFQAGKGRLQSSRAWWVDRLRRCDCQGSRQQKQREIKHKSARHGFHPDQKPSNAIVCLWMHSAFILRGISLRIFWSAYYYLTMNPVEKIKSVGKDGAS